MRLNQYVIIIGLFVLIILGLNLSNQGINRLTMDERGAILALGLKQHDIDLQVLGRNYTCSRDKLGQLKHQLAGRAGKLYREVRGYSDRYLDIFDTVIRQKSGEKPGNK